MEDHQMKYNDDSSAQIFSDWASKALSVPMINHVTLEYFGNLTNSKIADFGCGKGLFLKSCLEKGASQCFGFDANEPMIQTGSKVDNEQKTAKCPQFVVTNCFQPFDEQYGPFEFALCHFFLHVCSNETDLAIFFQNVFKQLKSGGKFFIGQNPYVANSVKDQQTVTDLCGHLQPLREDANGADPYLKVIQTFTPAVSSTGRPFTRVPAFTFTDYYWSKEKVMKKLSDVGFVNVQLLPAAFPDDILDDEKRKIFELEEPFLLIGAEKPREH